MSTILCGECARWQPDAKRQDGIRFGTCGMSDKRTERTTICRMPEAAIQIHVKRQFMPRKKKERVLGGRITRRTQSAYQLRKEGKTYKEVGEILGITSETARGYVRSYVMALEDYQAAGDRDNGHPVPVIGENTKTGEIIRFDSMADAQRIGGYDVSMISRCCAGARKTYRGYRWRKAKDDGSGKQEEAEGI